MPTLSRQVAEHYGRSGLLDRIRSALASAGFEGKKVTPKDLAPLDHFHTGGHDATLALAELIHFTAGARVLDVGGGIGGPARTLAQSYGCSVTVLDLTPEFVKAGTWLTQRTKQAGKVTFALGDALAMHFEPESFDIAWSQHSTMNIPDKALLFREIHRVLRVGGVYAFHEVIAGEGDLHYPVPWATDATTSHLQTLEATKADLVAAGFQVERCDDVTEGAIEWIRSRPQADPPPPLGLHVLFGPLFATLFANYSRNIEEGHVRAVRGVARRI